MGIGTVGRLPTTARRCHNIAISWRGLCNGIEIRILEPRKARKTRKEMQNHDVYRNCIPFLYDFRVFRAFRG